jgi:hypothetical protein
LKRRKKEERILNVKKYLKELAGSFSESKVLNGFIKMIMYAGIF